MSETTIEYLLLQANHKGEFFHRQFGPSEASLYAFAQAQKDSEDNHYKIAAIVTTRTVVDVFTVKASVKTVEDIAAEMSVVFASAVDYSHIDYVALSPSDQTIVQNLINEQIFDCAECGWSFTNDENNGDEMCEECGENQSYGFEKEEDDEIDE